MRRSTPSCWRDLVSSSRDLIGPCGFDSFIERDDLVIGLRQVDREHGEAGHFGGQGGSESIPKVGWSNKARTPRRGAGATTRTTLNERLVLESPPELDPLEAVETELDGVGRQGHRRRHVEERDRGRLETPSALASATRKRVVHGAGFLAVDDGQDLLGHPAQDQVPFSATRDHSLVIERVQRAAGFLDRGCARLVVIPAGDRRL